MSVAIASVLRRIGGGGLAVMLASAAWAEDTWHGDWAGDLAWCENADRIGSTTPAPIRLGEHEMLGYENSCEITQAQDVGLNAWVIDMTCQAEGDFYDERQLLMVDGDTLWIWYGGGEPLEFRRCGK